MDEKKDYIVPRNIIDEILGATDIVDIVSEHVALKKKGASYMGLCPFHKEKTPSFSVTPDRNGWHCFGCGEGGDAIKFLMRIENKPFMQVLRDLADRAGIALPERSSDEEEKFRFRAKLLEMNRASMEFFCQEGLPDEGLFPREEAEFFHIGVPGRGWYAHLRSQGFTEGEIAASGLWTFTEKNGRKGFILDGCRCIVPIMNRKDVIGFAGLDENGSWQLSKETSAFRTDRALYGLGQLDYRKNFMVLVRDIKDVVKLQMQGVPAVCPLKRLSAMHISVIRRYVKRVIVAYGSQQALCRRDVKTFYKQEDDLYGEGSALKKEPLLVRVSDGYPADSIDGLLYLVKSRERDRESAEKEARAVLESLRPGVERDNYARYLEEYLGSRP